MVYEQLLPQAKHKLKHRNEQIQVIIMLQSQNKQFLPNYRRKLKMIQIKSIATKKKDNQRKISELNSNMKIDFQIQCSINELPNRISKTQHQPNTHQKLRKDPIRQQKKSLNQRIMRNPQCQMIKTLTRFYENVHIKTINQSEQKIIKALQHIALNKKIDFSHIEAIHKQFVSLKALIKNGPLTENNVQIIKIKLQVLFRCYLQYHKRILNEAILLGNIVSKIIRPFLILVKKLKNDSQNIIISCQVNFKTKLKIITKSQIYKIFNFYLPKELLTKQLQRANEKYSKIYQQMYKKYQNLPFYSIPCQDNLVIDQQLTEEGDSQGLDNQENEQQLVEIDQKTSQSKVDNELQDESKKVKFLDALENQISNNSADEFKIKERFENRFQRQLKNLSEDAGNIIRSRLA